MRPFGCAGRFHAMVKEVGVRSATLPPSTPRGLVSAVRPRVQSLDMLPALVVAVIR